MRIQNNISAINTHRQYGINNANVAKSVEKLSSGYRINRAGDDAAGLAISEKMRGQIRGLNMASKNSQDAVSLIQTAEGALQSTHNILQRMRELSVQSSSDTNLDDVDREALQLEFSQLQDEIDQTADKTEFNKMKLINGDFGTKTTIDNTGDIHVGANEVTGFSLSGWKDTVVPTTPTGTDYTATFADDGTDLTVTLTDGTETWTAVLKTMAAGEGTLSIKFGTGSLGSLGGSISISVSDQFAAAGLDALAAAFNVKGEDKVIQVGANEGDELNLSIAAMNTDNLGTYGTNGFDPITGANTVTAGSSINKTDTNISTREEASAAITKVDNAISMVSMQRAALGAKQNRLEYKISNLDTSSENLQAAESRIRDVDMAKEMTNFMKNNILSQASTSMLAQANSLPQSVLSLLQG